MDVDFAVKLWNYTNPQFPVNRKQAEITMHMARTGAESVPEKHRFYSYRWLCDHGLPNQLPDRLKPSAEKMFPKKASVVGIATKTRSIVANAIRGAMSYAVLETYGDGCEDSEVVKKRMMEARDKILRQT